MAGPPEWMDLESRFHRALQGDHQMRIETRLMLGDLVLVLEPETGTDGKSDS
jgi:heat shock protein HslJ